MKTQIFITGQKTIPQAVKNENAFAATLVENLYDFRQLLKDDGSEKIIVAYVPFLEMKHFDLYLALQKSTNQTQTIFIVNELSTTMKNKLKGNKDFIVLWKTEEQNLLANIKSHLDGKDFQLRCDRRETLPVKALVGPTQLPTGKSNSFKPILAGDISNISVFGSCIQVKAPFYKPKEFVDISYQDKDGEYKSLHGQVRWISWNDQKEIQEVGVQFLGN